MSRPARIRSAPPSNEAAMARVEQWFGARGWTPFDFQREVWQAYRAGQSGLIHAATGMGKTYAAWMGPVAEAMESEGGCAASPGLRVLWITPLRALAGDTAESLAEPLRDLHPGWRVEIRTGDTSTSLRARQKRAMPHALVTTPESLSLLLSQPEHPKTFACLECVIVDEWHELMGSKRGVQTELCLARLRRLRTGLRTWGLSATIGNLEEALAYLVGVSAPGRLVRGVAAKETLIESLYPETMERFPWGGHLGLNLLEQVLDLLSRARSTLLFTNVRSQTEAWYRAILEARPEWSDQVALHHGSLDRELREYAERGIAAGALRCVVCTSSLDLGVDFAAVDQVLQVGSPKGIARLLQRAGRSGHRPGEVSRLTFIPAHALEYVEIAAARDAMTRGEIEDRRPPVAPLDVLAQHAITIAAGGGFEESELLREVRSTRSYQRLSDVQWQWVMDFATRGGPALGNYGEYRRVILENGRYVIASDRIAQRHRMSIGTISGDQTVNVRYLTGRTLGTIEESFISKLTSGSRFLFAGKTLELVRFQDTSAYVRKASQPDGLVPRWMGNRMSFSTQLATAVRAKLDEARRGIYRGQEMEAVRPILELQRERSVIPAEDELLIECVKTREGYHVFLFPFEGRLVHEGLSALCAYRLSRIRPLSLTMTCNDYGFEMLSAQPVPVEEGLAAGMLDPEGLARDIPASLNAAAMAKRQFREVARVAGLVFSGYPGRAKSARQVQVSSELLFDVLAKYDPGNLLLHQAQQEVLESNLEQSRLQEALYRLQQSRITVRHLQRPTPLAFPLLVDRLRGASVSSESVEDRVRRMQAALERDAG